MIAPHEHSFLFNPPADALGEQVGLYGRSSWLLFLVTAGSGMKLIDNTTERFECGDVGMIPPHTPHGWVSINDPTGIERRLSTITVTFTDEFLNRCSPAFPELYQYVEPLKQLQHAVKFDKRNSGPIASVLMSMIDQGPADRLASMFRLFTLLSPTDNPLMVDPHTKVNKEQERLKQIHTYVVCNATRDIALDDIVRYVGMNRSAFCVFFRRATGKTFITYLNEYRVEQACQLLRLQNMTVSEICYQVGFTNIPYFNRTFKKIKGCSPTRLCLDKPERLQPEQ